MEKAFIINGQEVNVTDFQKGDTSVVFKLNGESYCFNLVYQENGELVLEAGERFIAHVGKQNRDGESLIMTDGKEAFVSFAEKRVKKSKAQVGGLTSPMPGKIFKLLVKEGISVEKGDIILILEAMKMEHAIRADKDGIVKKINFKVGELVQGGVTLAELE